jgi:flagellar hook assembly protein FlgD
MIRSLLLLAFLLCLPSALLAQTRDTLMITKSSGEVIKVDISDLNRITFHTEYLGVEASGPAATTTEVFPNPTNDQVTLSFELKSAQLVHVEITSSDGILIRTIEQHCTPGRVEILWDGRDDRIARVASGNYFFKITTQENSITGKITIRR